ncbi:MAG: hypothetical protein M3014_01650 [Chloroflexota bacterium]|nr:hypothetical protein [Chloroflexota bacterium]
MSEPSNIGQIEKHCLEIQNSPYMRKDPPGELMKLRDLLAKVDRLTREDIPSLVAEVKRLRGQIKRMENDAEELRITAESQRPHDTLRVPVSDNGSEQVILETNSSESSSNGGESEEVIPETASLENSSGGSEEVVLETTPSESSAPV